MTKIDQKIFQGNRTTNWIGIEGIIFAVDVVCLKLVFVILTTFTGFFGAGWSSHTISRSNSVTPTLPPTSWGLNGPQSVSWYPQFVKLWNQWGPMSGQCVLWKPFGKSFPRTTVFPHLRDGRCEHKTFLKPLWTNFEKWKKTSFERKTEMYNIQEIVTSNILHSKSSLSRSCLLMLLNHQSEDREHEELRMGRAGLAHRQSRTSWGHQVMGLQPCSSLPTFLMGLHAMLMSGACVGWNWWIHQGRIPSGATWIGSEVRPM